MGKATVADGHNVDGYVIELKIDHGQTAQELLALLKRYKAHHWLDQYTQEIVIEIALYNNNLKLWSEVRLKAVFDQAGSVTTSHHVQTINLEAYNLYNIYNVRRFCFEIGLIIISLFKLVTEIMQCVSVQCSCRRYCSTYNAEGSNIGDIVQLVFSLFLLCMWFYNLISPEERLIQKQVTANTICHPPNLHHLIVWQEKFLLVCSFNILIILLTGLKFLLFFKGSARIWRVVKASMKHMKRLLFPLAIVILFAALFGHVKWGKDLTEWSTLLDAIYTVVQVPYRVSRFLCSKISQSNFPSNHI